MHPNPATYRTQTSPSKNYSSVVSIVRAYQTTSRPKLKYHYDKHFQPLMPLKKGDTVSFQKGHLWLPATILANTKFPRSYLITTPDGQTYHRNRRHLRPTRIHSEHQTEPGLDDGGSSDEEEERHKQQQEQTHNIIHSCARVQGLLCIRNEPRFLWVTITVTRLGWSG